MKAVLVCLVSLASSSTLSSCATSKTGTSTGAPAIGGTAVNSPRACGGDVVGHWVITSSDIRLDARQIGAAAHCPDSRGAGAHITMSGEATYSADGTFSETGTLAGSSTIDLPASCIGPGLTCADLSRAFVGEMFHAADCVRGGDGCSCALALRPDTGTNKGGYAMPSTGLLSQTEEGAPTSYLTDYCVDGKKMIQWPRPESHGGVSGSIVLEKR